MSDTTSAVASATNGALGSASTQALGMPTSPSTGVSTIPAAASSSTTSTTSSLSSGDTSAGTSAGVPMAQAIHSVNIKSIVPYVLDYRAQNYTKWSTLFLLVLGRFNLRHHVDDPAVHLADPAWIQENMTILQWSYATISDELFEMVMKLKDPSAHDVWRHLLTVFSGNKPTHAVHLEAEFYGMHQGDLSVTDYCHRLQQLANGFADCDQPVGERALVNQLICGLSPKYAILKTLLPVLPVFLSFLDARDHLITEENAQNATAKRAAETALAAVGATAPTSDNQNQRVDNNRPSSGNGDRGGRGCGGRGRNGRGRGGRGYGGRGPHQQYPGGHWSFPPWPAPWPGQWRAPWNGATGPRVLGSRPTNSFSAQNQVYVVMPQPTTTSAPVAPPSWDASGLIQALHATSLQQAPNEWVMDTGASQHMTGDNGSNHQERNHEVQ